MRLCSSHFGMQLAVNCYDMDLAAMHPVQAHLQTLVELDRIGCRKISTGAPNSEEITVYWLKKLWYQSSLRHIFI